MSESLNVVLISTYDLGHQPFGLASAAAWLKRAGANVVCTDLSVQTLETNAIRGADLIAFHIPMHTATQLCFRLLPKITAINPNAFLVCYGLYAPMNRDALLAFGVQAIMGGEIETRLLQLYQELSSGVTPQQSVVTELKKQKFILPDRDNLPSLDLYAHLLGPGGSTTMSGYTEASRGCKHLCRHCPIVPVYGGRFFVVDAEVVLADIAQQVAMGAKHITFGDPDFFNGPGHAMRIVQSVAEMYSGVTYDITVKVEHIRKHKDLIPRLAETGCLFVTTAVESFDDNVLVHLSKGHSRADIIQAVNICRAVGMNISPTFVAFTPWTTPESYLDLLQQIVSLELVPHVAPIQLTIRLLIPLGSHILQTESFSPFLESYNDESLSYGWRYEKSATVELEQKVKSIVATGISKSDSAAEIFSKLWDAAHQATGQIAPPLNNISSPSSHSMSEPWYCCAEPSLDQFSNL